MTLQTAIEKGLKEEANTIAARLVMTEEPLSVINEYMIPALNNVGKGFEKRHCIFCRSF